MATKGQKFKHWTAEEKYKIIKPVLEVEKSTHDITRETGLSNGMINNWIKVYHEKGMEGLAPYLFEYIYAYLNLGALLPPANIETL